MTVSDDERINSKNLYMRKFIFSDIDDMLKNWISDKDVQTRYREPIPHTVGVSARFFVNTSGQLGSACLLPSVYYISLLHPCTL